MSKKKIIDYFLKQAEIGNWNNINYSDVEKKLNLKIVKNNVKKVVALSTDKASSPVNIYGASKLTSDKLFIAANNYAGKNKNRFSVVRYGNVLGSKGSILPLFFKGAKNNLITVTDKRMTRFNITLKESVQLVVKVLNNMVGGEIFVPKIKSFRVIDLAKAIKPVVLGDTNEIAITKDVARFFKVASISDLNVVTIKYTYLENIDPNF